MPEGKVFRSILSEVTNKNAADEMLLIFGNKKEFSTPKPIKLIEQIIQLATDKDAIILDSFAGSGTTAHAVLNLNEQDGGNRKFILIEMEDYADTITAERVKRVINGYADKQPVNDAFDFYELDIPLFDKNGYLNEAVAVKKIRQYIFYTETGTTLPTHRHCVLNCLPELDSGQDHLQSPDNREILKQFQYDGVNENREMLKQVQHDGVNVNDYFLGNHNNTAYYFYYEKERITTLDLNFWASIKLKAGQYLIYADICLLSKDYLTANHILFKKIPRDITKI